MEHIKLLKEVFYMNNDFRYRHELKYDINYSMYLSLRSRLRQIMYPDEHAASDGKYLIRSIYFDNYRDKALQENYAVIQTPRNSEYAGTTMIYPL